jgi:hypothetical protein
MSSLNELRPSLDRMTPAQRSVIESLSPEELSFAVNLQQRLDAVTPEVEGQMSNTNNLC